MCGGGWGIFLAVGLLCEVIQTRPCGWETSLELVGFCREKLSDLLPGGYKSGYRHSGRLSGEGT